MTNAIRAVLVAAFLLPLSACGDDDPAAPDRDALARDFIEGYADILYANYADVVSLALDLQAAVNDFLADPSEGRLTAARNAWLTARDVYQQTEMARFYDGPIDREPAAREGFLNAWPLDENYIDYVEGAPSAGIINDSAGYPDITEEILRGANENGGEKNIAVGWHAVEFLLWGQDQSVGGPGDRPAADYAAGGACLSGNCDRRAEYLVLLATMLVEDLQSLREEWAPSGDYRGEFVALPVDEALSRILTGVGTLAFGEVRGERLVVPYTTKFQEDEHSCFSDNTHKDHLNDMIGIRNVWRGAYASSDGTLDATGTSLRELTAAVDADLADEVEANVDATVSALQAIPAPFDQAILGADSDPGRVAVGNAINALAEFNVLISRVAAALEVDITTAIGE